MTRAEGKTWQQLTGEEVTFKAKIAGFIDFGSEVQLQLPDGLLIYIPAESVLRALDEQ